MNGISPIGNAAVAAAAMQRSDEPESPQAIAVLKKALDADKNLVSELLPQQSGRLDIQA